MELVNLRIIAKVQVKDVGSPTPAARSGYPSPPVTRSAYFGPLTGTVEVPICSRADLVGHVTACPVIVEEYDSTIVVPPAWAVTVDAAKNVVLTSHVDNVDED